MPVHHMSKAAYVFGAVAVLVLAGCGKDDKMESIGDLLSRAGKGELPANGPRAANVVGLTDQTDLFFTMTDAIGINR